MLLIRTATILFGAVLGFYAVQFIRKYRLNLKIISELRRINIYIDLEIEDLRAELNKYKKGKSGIGIEEITGTHGSNEKHED